MKGFSSILATKIEFWGEGGSSVGFISYLYSLILMNKVSLLYFPSPVIGTVT